MYQKLVIMEYLVERQEDNKVCPKCGKGLNLKLKGSTVKMKIFGDNPQILKDDLYFCGARECGYCIYDKHIKKPKGYRREANWNNLINWRCPIKNCQQNLQKHGEQYVCENCDFRVREFKYDMIVKKRI